MLDKPRNTTQELHDYSILVDARELFLHGSFLDSQEDPGCDWRMATTLIKNLRYLDSLNKKPIVIHQYNEGGEEAAGMMIYDSIVTCSSYIILITHGIAGSMGSVIPQAADLRLSDANCEWLIHAGSTGINTELTITQSQVWGESELKNYNRMIEIYAKKCINGIYFKNKTLRQVKAALNREIKSKEDWILTGKEALKYGFVDGIYGSDEYPDMDTIKDFGYS